MLPDNTIAEIAKVVRSAEAQLLQMIQQNRVRQEPDMTSRLVHAIEIGSEEIDGISIRFDVVDGLGPGAAENQLGADVLGALRIELGDTLLAKGFLAQSKRAGSDGLHLVPVDDPERPSGEYGHWLWRGDLRLPASGLVSITRPSARLEEQCENMLRRSPDSFVFVFDPRQLGVVSASAVHAFRSRPPKTKTRSPLGTKRLDDFFVHLLDSFIGDRSLGAADVPTLIAAATAVQARAGMLLTVTDNPSR